MQQKSLFFIVMNGEKRVSNLKEQLRILVAMQKVEVAISDSEKELAGIEERVNVLNAELSEYQDRVTQHEQNLDDLRKQYRSDEDEVQMIETQVVKSKEKLGAVKTNKEYQSMLKEIDELKIKSSNLEDKMLEYLDQIESLEKDLIETNADLADVTSEVHQKQDEIRKNADQQRIELASLEQRRNDIWETIDAKLRSVYGNVKRQGQGIAMAQIIDGVCQVCRMNIPPQLFNDLLRMDSIRMCPHCQRIMYPKVVMDKL
jgi:predicted  nucleic acid-binding Zn-ribbon protein